MTKEDYCSRDVVKLLKEKGYKFPRIHLGAKHYDVVHLWDAKKWLIKNYEISVEPTFYKDSKKNIKWCVEVWQMKKSKELFWNDKYNTYEEVLNAGINNALNLI